MATIKDVAQLAQVSTSTVSRVLGGKVFVDEDTKNRRCEIIADLQMGVMDEYNQSLIGKEITVLCEGFDRYSEAFFGRSFADSPEVDGKVFFTCTGDKKPAPGAFVRVRIDEDLDGDPIGEFIRFDS